ncbi:hypothetical protein ACVWYG_001966 [Pedobacter sp. UYEF25]
MFDSRHLPLKKFGSVLFRESFYSISEANTHDLDKDANPQTKKQSNQHAAYHSKMKKARS